jgi:hypothetical protein
MTNTKTITETNFDGTETEFVIIEHADGSFTSMTKALYEAQQAEQSTPSLAVDAKEL